MRIFKQNSEEQRVPKEELEAAQSLRHSNLFFIKSKHAFRQYKNHEYFDDQSLDKKLKYRSREFVESPAPYGISNAYDYICEQISKNNIRKYNTTEKKFRTIHQRSEEEQQNRKSQTSNKQKRKTHFTLPNLQQSKKQLKERLLSDKQTNKYDPETRQLVNVRNNFSSHSRKTQNLNNIELQRRKKEYLISLAYVDVDQSVTRLHSFQLKLNVLTYIINTFLRAKINYLEMTDDQFSFVLNKIIQIFGSEREHMDYKDLVNFKSTKEIFDFVTTFNGEMEAKEALRYFFVAKKEVYQYQLNRLKDEIKDRLQFQFESSGKGDDVYLFDIDSGTQVKDLFQLIKKGQCRLVVGVDPTAWQIYKKFTDQENSRKKMVNRVTQWKSYVADKTHVEMSFRPITTQKYQSLFENVQKKRTKINRNRKKCEVSLKNSQFINREALFKDENIFQ